MASQSDFRKGFRWGRKEVWRPLLSDSEVLLIVLGGPTFQTSLSLTEGLLHSGFC